MKYSCNQIKGVTFIKGDIRDSDTIYKIQRSVDSKYDLVCSDAAPEFTGERLYDHSIMYELNKACINICWDTLKKGGSMLLKVFNGSFDRELTEIVGIYFNKIAKIKPVASRKESKEMYVYATQFLECKDLHIKLIYNIRGQLQSLHNDDDKERLVQDTLRNCAPSVRTSVLEKLAKCGYEGIIVK